MSEQDAVTLPIAQRPNSKLQPKDALYVRANYPTMTAQAIATELGVCKKTVLNIIHGKTFAAISVNVLSIEAFFSGAPFGAVRLCA